MSSLFRDGRKSLQTPYVSLFFCSTSWSFLYLFVSKTSFHTTTSLNLLHSVLSTLCIQRSDEKFRRIVAEIERQNYVLLCIWINVNKYFWITQLVWLFAIFLQRKFVMTWPTLWMTVCYRMQLSAGLPKLSEEGWSLKTKPAVTEQKIITTPDIFEEV